MYGKLHIALPLLLLSLFWVPSAAQESIGVFNSVKGIGATVRLQEKDGIFHTECVRMPHVADPTAAGDSFVGSFCTALSAGLPQKEALAFASHAAAITVSRLGAMPSLPTVSEVRDLLLERGYDGFDIAELDALM